MIKVKGFKKLIFIGMAVFLLSSCSGGGNGGSSSSNIGGANASENDLINQLAGINEGNTGQSFTEAGLSMQQVNQMASEVTNHFSSGLIGSFFDIAEANQQNQSGFSVEEESNFSGVQGACAGRIRSRLVTDGQNSANATHITEHNCTNYQPAEGEFNVNYSGRIASNLRASGNQESGNAKISFSYLLSFAGEYRGKIAVSLYREEIINSESTGGIATNNLISRQITVNPHDASDTISNGVSDRSNVLAVDDENQRMNGLIVISSNNEIFSCRASISTEIFNYDNLNLMVSCQRGNQAPTSADPGLIPDSPQDIDGNVFLNADDVLERLKRNLEFINEGEGFKWNDFLPNLTEEVTSTADNIVLSVLTTNSDINEAIQNNVTSIGSVTNIAGESGGSCRSTVILNNQNQTSVRINQSVNCNELKVIEDIKLNGSYRYELTSDNQAITRSSSGMFSFENNFSGKAAFEIISKVVNGSPVNEQYVYLVSEESAYYCVTQVVSNQVPNITCNEIVLAVVDPIDPDPIDPDPIDPDPIDPDPVDSVLDLLSNYNTKLFYLAVYEDVASVDGGRGGLVHQQVAPRLRDVTEENLADSLSNHVIGNFEVFNNFSKGRTLPIPILAYEERFDDNGDLINTEFLDDTPPPADFINPFIDGVPYGSALGQSEFDAFFGCEYYTQQVSFLTPDDINPYYFVAFNNRACESRTINPEENPQYTLQTFEDSYLVIDPSADNDIDENTALMVDNISFQYGMIFVPPLFPEEEISSLNAYLATHTYETKLVVNNVSHQIYVGDYLIKSKDRTDIGDERIPAGTDQFRCITFKRNNNYWLEGCTEESDQGNYLDYEFKKLDIIVNQLNPYQGAISFTQDGISLEEIKNQILYGYQTFLKISPDIERDLLVRVQTFLVSLDDPCKTISLPRNDLSYQLDRTHCINTSTSFDDNTSSWSGIVYDETFRGVNKHHGWLIRELGQNELDQRMAIHSMLAFNENDQLEKHVIISVKSGDELYHCQAKHLENNVEDIQIQCILVN